MPADYITERSETRSDAKRRLMREGRWKDFLKRREVYENQGMNSGPAHTEALKDFPPIEVVVGEGGPEVVVKDQSPPAAPTKVRRRRSRKAVGAATLPEVTRGTFEGKSGGSVREVIQYVFEHVSLPYAELDPEDAPGAGAWGLLIHCKTSPQALSEFYTKTWPKILPSKTELERLSRFADDGRTALDLLDRIRANLDQGERDAREEAESD